jgi:hypothetical protein
MLCWSLLVGMVWLLGLRSIYGGLFSMVPGSLFPVIVYACTVNLLISDNVLIFIYVFLTFDPKKKELSVGKSS